MPYLSPLRYTVSVESTARRLLRVVLEIPRTPIAESVVLRMPAWTPGSYMIREYARHVVSLSARDASGRSVGVRRLSKDRWRVAAPARVEWLLYANELTVRSNHVDDTHAFVQPTATFLCPEGMEDRPLTVAVRAPRGWDVATSLCSRGGVHEARDQEALHDAPIHLGHLRRFPFRVRGVPHELVLWGSGNEDGKGLAADLAKIVAAGARMFGALPYDRFVVHGLLSDGGGGGLEHRDGFVFQLPRFGFKPRKARDRALTLLAHEFFHAWNVRRIRPAGLLPYDLTGEKYTRLLWQFEGATSYYEVMLLARAGLWNRARALEAFAERIGQLLAVPGRRRMSLADASLTAWVKYYRPDENSGNAAVSYYLKGALAALALDLQVRAGSGGRRSYDDVMRILWRRHGRKPVPETAMTSVIAEVGGAAAARLHRRLVEETAEIDWKGLWAPFGVGFETRAAGVPEGWEAGGWLGVETEEKGGRTLFRAVRADGPAAEAIAAGDELVALDGIRATGESLPRRLAEKRAGARVRLTLLRGDRLLEREVRLARPPEEKVALVPDAKAPAAARRLLDGWLR